MKFGTTLENVRHYWTNTCLVPHAGRSGGFHANINEVMMHKYRQSLLFDVTKETVEWSSDFMEWKAGSDAVNSRPDFVDTYGKHPKSYI